MERAEGSRIREFLTGPNAGNSLEDNIWQKGSIIRSGLFAEYHLRQWGIRWVLSGRMGLNISDALDPDEAFTSIHDVTREVQLNPSISMGGTLALSRRITLGMWLGRAQRSGSLTERFINFFPVGQDPYELVGNPMIDPEVVNQADLNLQWNTEKMALRLDLFAAFLQDPISSVIDTSLNPRIPSSPGVRRYTNLDRAFKTGCEASWSQSLFSGLQHRLSMAYTYGQDLDRKEPLPEIAPLDFRYHLAGSYLDHRLIPFVDLRYVLAQNRISIQFGETVTPSFAVLDLGVSFQLSRMIGIRTGVNNLLNASYYEHLNRSVRDVSVSPIRAPGRSYFLSFSLDFR
jgi:iron complex outermembrane receptor protein